MRRPWIKIEICTPDKPEICSLATQLRLDDDAVVGKLVRLWSWAELNRVDPNDLGVTKEFIDKIVGRKGFAAALEKTGWLIETDGKLSFRNFKRHNSPVAQNKALTAKRVARHRLRKAAEIEKITDSPLPSKPVKAPKSKKKAATSDIAVKVINTVYPLIANDEYTSIAAPKLIESAQESAVETLTVFEELETLPIEASEETTITASEEDSEPLVAEEKVVGPAVQAEEISNVSSEPFPVEVAITALQATLETAVVTAPVEESPQRKKRSKAAAIDDQPMLF